MDNFLPRLGALLLFTFLGALGLVCWAWARLPEAKATAAACGIVGFAGMVAVMVHAIRRARRARAPTKPHDDPDPKRHEQKEARLPKFS